MIDGVAAAQWLLNLGSVDPGLCLYYVWQAYKAQGASTDLGAGTAYEAWGLSRGQRPGDRNPPAGAAVWWGRRYDGNLDGDVTISLGGGMVAATDYPGWRQTGACTLDEREDQIGREYLGWTSSIFDCPLDVAAGKDAAASTSTPITTSEEDDMRAIRQAGVPGSGIIIQPGIPPYALDEQVFLTLASSYGLTIIDLPDWKYQTVVREHWTAFGTAQQFANTDVSPGSVTAIAEATRKALDPKA